MNIDLENDDYFLCSWNGTEITQIHTKESLIEEYKKTGLLEDDGWWVERSVGYGTIIDMMNYQIRRKWPFQPIYNGNMTIMYIKMKD